MSAWQITVTYFLEGEELTKLVGKLILAAMFSWTKSKR